MTNEITPEELELLDQQTAKEAFEICDDCMNNTSHTH